MQDAISVVIPVYNGARFLADTVACVRSQQVPVEIIAVDDGSTDSTADVAAGLGIVCIRQENAGPAAARNRGIGEASGEYIAFLDVDDMWTPGALSALCAALRQNPHADVAHGCMQWAQVDSGTWNTIDAPRKSTQVGSMLFRRSVFSKVGLFNETLRFSEDTDWYMRATDSGVQITAIRDVVLLYRLHEYSATHGRTAGDMDILRVVRASLERRRENS